MPSWYKNDVVSIANTCNNGGNCRFQLPPDTVASYRLAVLFANGKPNLAVSCALTLAWTVQHNKVAIRYACGMLIYVVVLKVFFKSVYRLQSVTLLCGKLMTTLISASCECSTSAGSLHSCAETVHFTSLSFLGLISSFHFLFSFFGDDCNFLYLLAKFTANIG